MGKFNFIDYMCDCATNLKDIRHSAEKPGYFRVTNITQLEELLQNLPDAQFPALIVNSSPEGVVGDFSNSDNILDHPTYLFYVVDKTTFGDIDSQVDAKANCKAIVLKILSKLIYDKRKQKNGLAFLQLGSIQYYAVGPIGDNCFGIGAEFSLYELLPVEYDPKDWDA